MEKKKDVFDKIMSLPGFNLCEPFYKKHKEVILYIFFGGVTFFLNIILFAFLNIYVGMNELVANVICWIACVLFQFFTNRLLVFNARTDTVKGFVGQMAAFFGGRLFTLVVEEAILLVFITWLGLNSIIIKLIAQVLVIVLNYVISKKLIFK